MREGFTGGAESAPPDPPYRPFALADVERAAARIAGHVHRTPVITSRLLDRELGCQVVAKGEQGGERPPGLERPDPLQVLGLGHHLAAELPVQQAGGDDRGAVCLLYTSPSPRDLSTSRMPSSA